VKQTPAGVYGPVSAIADISVLVGSTFNFLRTFLFVTCLIPLKHRSVKCVNINSL
jgi:hypothetical protein